MPLLSVFDPRSVPAPSSSCSVKVAKHPGAFDLRKYLGFPEEKVAPGEALRDLLVFR